jgi:hypothetical protein
MTEARRSSDGRDAVIKAVEALEAARQMPRGNERARALKEAGRLRCIVDLKEWSSRAGADRRRQSRIPIEASEPFDLLKLSQAERNLRCGLF